jgi:hypothetical protein
MYIADRRDIEALGDIHNRRAQRDRSQESHVKTSKRGRSIL